MNPGKSPAGRLHQILLIGLRGAGKSSVGAELAQRLRIPFFDSDEQLEKRWQLSAGEFLLRFGEEEFRKRESELLQQLAHQSPALLSLGGGAFERIENRDLFCRWHCLMLDAPDEVLHLRMQEPSAPLRPALTDLDPIKEIALLRARRMPAFLARADAVFNSAGKSAGEVADEIFAHLAK